MEAIKSGLGSACVDFGDAKVSNCSRFINGFGRKNRSADGESADLLYYHLTALFLITQGIELFLGVSNLFLDIGA